MVVRCSYTVHAFYVYFAFLVTPCVYRTFPHAARVVLPYLCHRSFTVTTRLVPCGSVTTHAAPHYGSHGSAPFGSRSHLPLRLRSGLWLRSVTLPTRFTFPHATCVCVCGCAPHRLPPHTCVLVVHSRLVYVRGYTFAVAVTFTHVTAFAVYTGYAFTQFWLCRLHVRPGSRLYGLVTRYVHVLTCCCRGCFVAHVCLHGCVLPLVLTRLPGFAVGLQHGYTRSSVRAHTVTAFTTVAHTHACRLRLRLRCTHGLFTFSSVHHLTVTCRVIPARLRGYVHLPFAFCAHAFNIRTVRFAYVLPACLVYAYTVLVTRLRFLRFVRTRFFFYGLPLVWLVLRCSRRLRRSFTTTLPMRLLYTYAFAATCLLRFFVLARADTLQVCTVLYSPFGSRCGCGSRTLPLRRLRAFYRLLPGYRACGCTFYRYYAPHTRLPRTLYAAVYRAPRCPHWLRGYRARFTGLHIPRLLRVTPVAGYCVTHGYTVAAGCRAFACTAVHARVTLRLRFAVYWIPTFLHGYLGSILQLPRLLDCGCLRSFTARTFHLWITGSYPLVPGYLTCHTRLPHRRCTRCYLCTARSPRGSVTALRYTARCLYAYILHVTGLRLIAHAARSCCRYVTVAVGLRFTRLCYWLVGYRVTAVTARLRLVYRFYLPRRPLRFVPGYG